MDASHEPKLLYSEKYLDIITKQLARIVEQNAEAIELCKTAATTNVAWMDEIRLHWEVTEVAHQLDSLLRKLHPRNPKEPQT